MTVTSPFQTAADTTASNGRYLWAPNTAPDQGAPGPIMATYRVTITQPGEYVLWGRAMAPNGGDDSFFVQVDGGTDNLWDVTNSAGWSWDRVSHRGGGTIASPQVNPVRFTLGAGVHTIRIKQREAGTRLDKLLLTSDPILVPTGTGGAAENLPPASTETHWLEAEYPSSLVSPFRVAAGGAASNGFYIWAPNSAPDQGSPGPVAATYHVTLTQPGEYVLWGRVRAPDGDDDSFFVQVDNGADNLWDVTNSSGWSWDRVSHRGNGSIATPQINPVRFTLAAGTHTIRIKQREAGTRLDKLYLASPGAAAPTGTGGSAENLP